jgi:cell division protein FtsA
MEGSPFHTSVLPIGGINVTNDVAIGLKTNLTAAEQLKIQVGTADPSSVDPEEEVPVELIGETDARTALRMEVAEIIEARMRELFEKIGAEITRGGSAHRLPAGLVLTGGGALLAGSAELGREVLQMPVRVATPAGVGGLTDHLLTPGYSSAIGLLHWASRVVTTQEPQTFESAPAGASLTKMREWLKGLFP